LRADVFRNGDLRADVLRDGDLRADDFFDAELREAERPEAVRETVFFAGLFAADFLDDRFDAELPDDERFAGTLPPALRASERPIAMACLRLVTFLPEPPLRNVPCLRSCIAFFTLLCAVPPYLAIMCLL